MQLVNHDKDTDVFEFNKEGDLFYLVLDGIVEVWQPDPEHKLRYQEVTNEISIKE
jgi:hypothetical protein